MNIKTRALTAQDYAQARALYMNLSTAGTLPDMETGRAGFERLLDHPGTSIIAACEEDQLRSMATLHILPNLTYDMRPYALIENVATHPDHQRLGWGRRVMTAAAGHAWRENAFKIMLLTNQSRGVRAFYDTLGYSADEKHGMVLRAPG